MHIVNNNLIDYYSHLLSYVSICNLYNLKFLRWAKAKTHMVNDYQYHFNKRLLPHECKSF